jgi:hypothetical protein
MNLESIRIRISIALVYFSFIAIEALAERGVWQTIYSFFCYSFALALIIQVL